MSETYQLLPCPFCGVAANQPTQIVLSSGVNTWWIVACQKDACRTCLTADSANAVASRWNARAIAQTVNPEASKASVVEAIDELAEAITKSYLTVAAKARVMVLKTKMTELRKKLI